MIRMGGAALVGMSVMATAAFAVEPVGSDKFNVTAHVVLAQVNRGNFASMITPVAKQQKSHEIVFYDFADTLCELLSGEVAKFTADTGIPVKHVCVEGDAATQQFILAMLADSA